SGETHSFEYDSRGRLVSCQTDDMEIRFAYDFLGNRVEDLRNAQGVKHEFRGKKLVETTIFDRFTTHYRHTKDGTVLMKDPGGKTQRVRFQGNGLIVRDHSNGTSEVAQFDSAGRCLAKLSLRSTASLLTWSRRFTYSPAGALL